MMIDKFGPLHPSLHEKTADKQLPTRIVLEQLLPEMRAVDEMHRLIDDQLTDASDTDELVEVFSSTINQRIIATPLNSETTHKHYLLANAGIPVLEANRVDGLLLLQVPEGAVPVTNLLTAISRHPERYSRIFTGAGRVLRQLVDQDFGIPYKAGRSQIFNRLAYSVTPDNETGVTLTLAPPYSFNTENTSSDSIYDLALAEITGTGVFKDTEIIKSLSEYLIEGYIS